MSPTTGALEEHPGQFANSYEKINRPEEEYFRRLPPATSETRAPKTSGIRAALASNNQDEDQVGSGATEAGEQLKRGHVDRTPTVVHRQARVKSNEGLLRHFQSEDGTEDVAETPVEPADSNTEDDSQSIVEEPLSRPGSLEAQHARRVSSGSARLLDIPSRRDSQRSSTFSSLPPRGP